MTLNSRHRHEQLLQTKRKRKQHPDWDAVNNFIHRPLDISRHSTRVFRVRKAGEFIECELRHIYDLSGYTAISYVWGTAPPTFPIKVDGAPFFVRHNLFQLLTELCQRETQDELWIDALCIDQSNVEERNHQVAQMADIYKNAKEVIYWLGEGNCHSDECFDYFFPQSPETKTGEHVSYVDFETKVSGLCHHPHQIDITWALRRISSAEYWRRSWTVQELLLSRHRGMVSLGSRSIPWTEFAALFTGIESNVFTAMRNNVPEGLTTQIFTTPISKFLSTAKRFKDGGLTLPTVLKEFGKTQCADRRDRVFAFRMILQDPSAVRVDYNLSVGDLFCEIASKHAQQASDEPLRSVPPNFKFVLPGQPEYFLSCLGRALEVSEADLNDSNHWKNLDRQLRDQILNTLHHLQRFPGG